MTVRATNTTGTEGVSGAWSKTGYFRYSATLRMPEMVRHTGSSRREAGQYAEMESLAHHGDYWARTEIEMMQLALNARRHVGISPQDMVLKALGGLALAEHGLR